MAAPITEEILLELREANINSQKKLDANAIEIAGDYQVTLNERVTINEGDEISIKSVFCDSVDVNAEKIVIGADDATITIESGLYLYDWGFADSSNTYTSQRFHYDTTVVPSGKTYYLAEEATRDGTMDEVFSFVLYADPQDEGSWDPKGKNKAVIALDYKDIHNSPKILYFEIKKDLIKVQGEFNVFEINRSFVENRLGMPLFIKAGSLKATTNKTELKKMTDSGVYINKDGYNVGLVEITEFTNISDTKQHFTPKTFTTTFSIPQGSYTPLDLSEAISDKLSEVKPIGQDYIDAGRDFTDSNFLYGNNELLVGGGQPKYVASDGSDIVQFATGTNYWVGSSQVGLLFNQDTQKFNFQRTHSSIYSEKGLSIIKTVGTGARRFMANKTGGVWFSDLKPHSLWKNKLGFELNHASPTSLIIKENNTREVTTGLSGLNNSFLSDLPLVEGLSITGDAVDLDALIFKKIDSANDQFFDEAPSNFDTIDTAGSNPIVIPAKDGFGSSENDGNIPYYQIEVDVGQSGNKKYGANKTNNKISAIISRYYSSDSYSSSMDNSGSVSYLHKGNPFQISKANVRILGPDGKLVTDIGSDNTVFVSIMKPK